MAAVRGEALRDQVAVLMSKGWTAWLITLTVKHGRSQPLATVFDGLKDGWRKLTSGKAWQDLKVLGAPEYVRGYDLTHSDFHGWHPHFHLSLYLPPGHGDGRSTAEAVLARWQSVMRGLGWETSPDAQDAQPCRDPAKAARYSVTPAAVYEAVAMANKRSRKARSGRTPFEILRAAVADADAGLWHGSRPIALWREYVAGTKGRRQVTASRGITLADEPDLEAVQGDVLAELGRGTIRELDAARRVPELLEAVEAAAAEPDGSPGYVRETVREILDTLESRDWSVTEVGYQVRRRGVPEPSEPWRPPPPPAEIFPPADWSSPFLECGRSWRPVRKRDLPILVRLAREAGATV